jgi:hypothetical protein
MNIKLSEEKIKILKEEGIIFKDAIDGKKYYQFPKQVYKETENELIFELVDRIIPMNKTPIQELIEEIKESCIQDYFSANAEQSKLIVSVCNNIIKKAEEKLLKEKFITPF